MTYTFKLSRRLAVSRRVGYLPLLLLFLACNGDATAPENDTQGPQGDRLPRQAVTMAVSVHPNNVTVETNQLIRFLARGHNSAGDSVYAPITWSATGGTILPDGRFSSATTGSFMVMGTTRTREEKIDTSTVVVVRRQLHLAALQIAPQEVTLAPRVSQTFLATGILKNGRPVPVGATWTTTGGGTIDAGGVYVPGDTAGTYQVIATGLTSGVADTATVSITAPPAPPPPPPATPPVDSSPTPPVDSSPTPPAAPVLVRLSLLPGTATVAPSATRQFSVTGQFSDGSSSVVPATYIATGGSITSDGLYKAGTTVGTFAVIAKATGGTLADTSAVSIVATLGSGPVAGACLLQSGPLVSLSGESSSRYDSRTSILPEDVKVDARTASWTGWSFPVNVASKPGMCWTGGVVQGTLEEATPWTTWHSTSAFYIWGERAVVEGLRADNYGDGVRFTPSGTKNWTLRGVHFTKMHDDCVENDRLESGLVEDVLLDGCYVGFSARPGNAFQDQVNGSANTVTVRNSLVRLRRQVSVYKGVSPSSGGFFKVESDLVGINVSWVLENNIFRADGPSGIASLCLNLNGKFTARNNIMVWLGEGDYPCALPSGWTLTRDRTVWDNAVAGWKARHPGL
jgi:hypothetical protein